MVPGVTGQRLGVYISPSGPGGAAETKAPLATTEPSAIADRRRSVVASETRGVDIAMPTGLRAAPSPLYVRFDVVGLRGRG
jgi:hypothetical protein